MIRLLLVSAFLFVGCQSQSHDEPQIKTDRIQENEASLNTDQELVPGVYGNMLVFDLSTVSPHKSIRVRGTEFLYQVDVVALDE